MNLNDVLLRATAHRRKKRVGRGAGSGMGKTAGRGQKGLGARTGANRLRGYVGGQTQLKERLPKVGFSNKVHAVTYLPLNLAFLEERFSDGETVDVYYLREKGFNVRRGEYVKLLGNGTLTKKFVVGVHAISASARKKVEDAGGSVELITTRWPAGNRFDDSLGLF